VATVGEDHHVALHKIIPGRDFGTEIEIQDGVGPGDVVVADPPDSLMDGALVRIAPGKTP
jgi:multidrug efflux pump subunit AcrA (membrane-fusion protein)